MARLLHYNRVVRALPGTEVTGSVNINRGAQMPRRGIVLTLVLIVLAVSIVGCTRVKPEPEESLSLSTGKPSLSADVAELPSSATDGATPVALAIGTSTDSPVAAPAEAEAVAVAAPAPTPTPLMRTITHTVGWGDTVLSLALQYGARMEEISRINNLENNVIYVGQVLTIPLPSVPAGAEQYVVQPGDSLYSIAEYLSVTVDDLMATNGLTNGYYLQVGQVLVVPSGGVLPAASTSVQAAALGQTRTHIVQPGDSLSSLALMYDVAAEDIAKVNNIVDANLLQVGDTLIIP